MMSRWLPLALSIVLLWQGILHAQTAPAYPGPKFPDAFNPSSAASTNYDKMYEDIEIMRRILGNKLQPLYPRVSVPNLTSNPFTSTAAPADFFTLYNRNTELVFDGASNKPQLAEPKTYVFSYPQHKEEALSSLEGVYLKGQGVVYTATLSSLQPSEKARAENSLKALADSSFADWSYGLTARQDSEWDSVRRQVRNEKDKPKKPEGSKPPTLSDVLLKTLADNGHNFSLLGADESLTLVLTVHETPVPSSAQKSATGGPGVSARSGSQAQKPVGSSNRGSDVTTDLELLGDLHQKQGRFEEALNALEGAAAREPGPSPNEAFRLYRKMAQCFLALGQDEKARKALDHMNSLRKEARDAKDKQAPAAKPAAALPVKLIISAPKKLLDQVKEGKITFEEFRRQARVETLRFDDRR